MFGFVGVNCQEKRSWGGMKRRNVKGVEGKKGRRDEGKKIKEEEKSCLSRGRIGR